MRAIRVFTPQILGVSLATGSGMAWAAVYAAHPIAVVPFVVVTFFSAFVTLISGISKASNIDVYGWDSVDPPRACKRCTVLAADLAETRKALLELQP